jgi:glutamate-1-semialdehyde 2,1-aminomutase
MGTGGRDPVAFDQSFRLPWNKPDVIDKVLEKYWREVAMILVEPVQAAGCFEPKPGFLDHLRDLCDHYGILLCFDEVVTGFRLALGGAQEAYGVTPDLAT